MQVPEDILKVKKSSVCIYTEEEVEQSIHQLATEISRDFNDKAPIILCIMRGGLVLTGRLLPLLKFPLQLDYVQVSRYNNTTTGKAVDWYVTPQVDLESRHIIIVDDILDGGHTLLEVKNACSNQNAASVSTVVLVDKLHDRKVQKDFKADYCGLEVEDKYLYGYGMDYKSWFRNEAGIYAVEGDSAC